MKYFYLIFMIFGLMISYSLFITYLSMHGMNIEMMIGQLFSSRITSFFTLDLTLSAIVFIVFMIFEGRKIKMKYYWIPAVTVIGIGLSFGLPLFLYMRKVHLEK